MKKDNPGVLIVDDEPGILDALEDLLEDDFDVITSLNPKEGLEILKTREIGVVLSDQRMPSMQGHEFLAEVSKRSQATRMLITGYTDLDALVKAINKSQIFAFVSKPWDPDQLKSLVETAMEHFKLARELMYEKHLMINLMNTVPAPIFFIDQQGDLLKVNTAGRCLLGESSPESRSVREFVEKNPSLAPLLLKGNPEKAVVPVIDAEGQKHWHSAVQVEFGDGEGIISVSHDVTERHEAELALARQAAELEESYRDIHQFAHVTSHHLQEPLRDVVSHLQLLGLRLTLDDRERESLDFAVNGARRMKELFCDFIRYIDFDTRNAPLEPVPLRALIDETLRVREKSLTERKCSPEVPDEMPDVLGHTLSLQYIFDEIVENAIKFGPEDALELTVASEATDDTVKLTFSDNGLGIAKGEEEKIFGLFQKLHPMDRYRGTGLGLALCRKIMHLHGGTAYATSNYPDRGMSVVLKFPRHQNE